MIALVIIVVIVVAGLVLLVRAGFRSPASSAPASAPVPIPRPVVNVGQSDLERAQYLLDRFNESQTPRGGGDEVYRAVRAIAEAGSSVDSPIHARSGREFGVMTAKNYARDGNLGMDEPWYWLAAVAELAVRYQNHHLLASIAFFTNNWLVFITPRISAGDEQEMRLLKGVPQEPRVRIVNLAMRGLSGADYNHVLIRDPLGGSGPFTVHQVLVGLAIGVCKEPAEYSAELHWFARTLTNQDPHLV